jgi:flagellar biosynthesis anti-sigma factor FlgM
MTINNNQPPDASRLSDLALDQTQGSSRATGTSASTPAGTGSTAGDDLISLSNSSSLVQQALQSSSSARQARVQELKALVQSGQYEPDASAVSSALIDAHLNGS